ncbi:hypothetical protein M758_UG057500 [Ceratodon purpureus]|nr:hypothetical protein M758_UG057500 [Ceratodon purpureus]
MSRCLAPFGLLLRFLLSLFLESTSRFFLNLDGSFCFSIGINSFVVPDKIFLRDSPSRKI